MSIGILPRRHSSGKWVRVVHRLYVLGACRARGTGARGCGTGSRPGAERVVFVECHRQDVVTTRAGSKTLPALYLCVFCAIVLPCFRSSTDRMQACGACDCGSIPHGSTRKLFTNFVVLPWVTVLAHSYVGIEPPEVYFLSQKITEVVPSPKRATASEEARGDSTRKHQNRT